jgi:hypothetical protein
MLISYGVAGCAKLSALQDDALRASARAIQTRFGNTGQLSYGLVRFSYWRRRNDHRT